MIRSIKLLCNVVYGYTSAGLSGRMPCAEVAESIICLARGTLERAIKMVDQQEGCRVIYGDTDSLFVQIKRETMDGVFVQAEELAKRVTADNPFPVCLKVEKVYKSCLIGAKKRFVCTKQRTKRYAGYKINRKDGKLRVRADSFPLLKRVSMERGLALFFANGRPAALKTFLESQWRRMARGEFPGSDFVISKKVRMCFYSDLAKLPPAAAIAYKRFEEDSRNEPFYGERVQFIVSKDRGGNLKNGRQLRRRIEPAEVLNDFEKRVEVDCHYYTTRLNKALERIFKGSGFDIGGWFSASKRLKFCRQERKRHEKGRESVRRFFGRDQCASCFVAMEAQGTVRKDFCAKCLRDKALLAYSLSKRQNSLEKELFEMGIGEGVLDSLECVSVCCERKQRRKELEDRLREVVGTLRRLEE